MGIQNEQGSEIWGRAGALVFQWEEREHHLTESSNEKKHSNIYNQEHRLRFALTFHLSQSISGISLRRNSLGLYGGKFSDFIKCEGIPSLRHPKQGHLI